MDKDRVTGIIYLHFSKAFDTVPYNIHLSKVETDGYIGCSGWTVMWIKNWLGQSHAEAVINGSESQHTVISNVPQESLSII